MTQPDATPARCDAPSMRAARWMMAGGARFGHSHGGQVEFQGGIEAVRPPFRHRAPSGQTSVGDALWRSWHRRSHPAPIGRPPDSEHGRSQSEACACNVWRGATVHKCIERRRSRASWRVLVLSPGQAMEGGELASRPGRQSDLLRRRRGALCATDLAAISADQARLHEHNAPTPLANNDFLQVRPIKWHQRI